MYGVDQLFFTPSPGPPKPVLCGKVTYFDSQSLSVPTAYIQLFTEVSQSNFGNVCEMHPFLSVPTVVSPWGPLTLLQADLPERTC